MGIEPNYKLCVLLTSEESTAGGRVMGATGGMVGATGGLTLAIILGLDSSLSTLVSDTGTSVGSLP